MGKSKMKEEESLKVAMDNWLEQGCANWKLIKYAIKQKKFH